MIDPPSPLHLKGLSFKKNDSVCNCTRTFCPSIKIALFSLIYWGIPIRQRCWQPAQLKNYYWIHKYVTEITAYTKSDLHSQDQRAEAAILFDCITWAVTFSPDALESGWKAWIWLKRTQKAHRSGGMRNVPVTHWVCCSGPSPSFTTSLCRQVPAPRAPQAPAKPLRNPPQNLPRDAFTFPCLLSWAFELLPALTLKDLEEVLQFWLCSVWSSSLDCIQRARVSHRNLPACKRDRKKLNRVHPRQAGREHASEFMFY